MGKRKDIITCIDWAKYVAFVAATVCVLVFQFISATVCITIALAFYVVAFGLMFVSTVVHCVEVYNANKTIKEQNNDATIEKDEEKQLEEGGLKGEKVEVVHLKGEIALTIVGAVFYGLFTIFTFVVLVLY